MIINACQNGKACPKQVHVLSSLRGAKRLCRELFGLKHMCSVLWGCANETR